MTFRSTKIQRQGFLQQFRNSAVDQIDKICQIVKKISDDDLLIDVYSRVVKTLPYQKKRKIIQSILLKQSRRPQITKIKVDIMRQARSNGDQQIVICRMSSVPYNTSKKVGMWISPLV